MSNLFKSIKCSIFLIYLLDLMYILLKKKTSITIIINILKIYLLVYKNDKYHKIS